MSHDAVVYDLDGTLVDLAVEQGRAVQANVNGSTIAAIEAFLDIELADSR